MPILDSRLSSIMPDIPVYQTSEPSENDWGQPAISHYVFYIKDELLCGDPIGGTYLYTQPTEELIATDKVLTHEMSSWDIASDEALSNFEAGLE